LERKSAQISAAQRHSVDTNLLRRSWHPRSPDRKV